MALPPLWRPLTGVIALCSLLVACSSPSMEHDCPPGTAAARHTHPEGQRIECVRGSEGAGEGKVVKHGPAISWFSNGQVERTVHYTDGLLDGPSIVFHPNGVRASSGAYAQGKKVGLWTFLDVTGITLSVKQYREGVLHGVQKEYFADGRIKGREAYRAGKRHGPSTTFHASGERHLVGQHVDGQRSGQWIEWSAEGAISRVRHYRAGREVAAPDAPVTTP